MANPWLYNYLDKVDTTSGPYYTYLVDETQTPDTLLSVFTGMMVMAAMHGPSYGHADQVKCAFWTKDHFTDYQIAPYYAFLIDETQTPDTLLSMFQGMMAMTAGFYPFDLTGGTKDTAYAGDMGAYIG